LNIFRKLLIYLIAGAFIFTAGTLAIAVNQLENNIQILAQRVELMDKAVKEAEHDAIQKALEFAPKGRSIYQLRGEAQTEVQRLLDRLTTKYELPRYELEGIRFQPSLRDSGRISIGL